MTEVKVDETIKSDPAAEAALEAFNNEVGDICEKVNAEIQKYEDMKNETEKSSESHSK